MTETTTGPHRIEDGTATCTASEGSPCRLGCPEEECEAWSTTDGCVHGPLKDFGKCFAVEWVNAAGLYDTLAEGGGDPDTLTDYRGPIDVKWDIYAGYMWRPTDAAATSPKGGAEERAFGRRIRVGAGSTELAICSVRVGRDHRDCL
jgi:hypothetical protein